MLLPQLIPDISIITVPFCLQQRNTGKIKRFIQ